MNVLQPICPFLLNGADLAKQSKWPPQKQFHGGYPGFNAQWHIFMSKSDESNITKAEKPILCSFFSDLKATFELFRPTERNICLNLNLPFYYFQRI